MMTEAELQTIERWASRHVQITDRFHSAVVENVHRDQVMALIAEVRRLRDELEVEKTRHVFVRMVDFGIKN